MPPLADDLRRAAQAGRQAAAGAAQREVTVALTVTTYTAPVNMAGASVSSTTTTTLSPAPRVRETSSMDPNWFGGGAAVDAGADLAAKFFEVGPITPAHAGGGYDVATLYPAASSSKRVAYRLSGGEFGAQGELFRPVALRRSSPQSTWLLLQRTAQ